MKTRLWVRRVLWGSPSVEKSVSSTPVALSHFALVLAWRWREVPLEFGAKGKHANATPFSLLMRYMPTAVRELSFQLPPSLWSCSSAARGPGEGVSRKSSTSATVPGQDTSLRMSLTSLCPTLFSRCSATEESQPRGCQQSQGHFCR